MYIKMSPKIMKSGVERYIVHDEDKKFSVWVSDKGIAGVTKGTSNNRYVTADKANPIIEFFKRAKESGELKYEE